MTANLAKAPVIIKESGGNGGRLDEAGSLGPNYPHWYQPIDSHMNVSEGGGGGVMDINLTVAAGQTITAA